MYNNNNNNNMPNCHFQTANAAPIKQHLNSTMSIEHVSCHWSPY